MFSNSKKLIRKSVYIGEQILALPVLVAVVLYTVGTVSILLSSNWSDSVVFYEFINRILIALVAFELVRLLVTHDIHAVSDLLTFVIARKLLKPDLTVMDVLLGIVAFGILAIINAKVLRPSQEERRVEEFFN
jgi:hypothetical protein